MPGYSLLMHLTAVTYGMDLDARLQMLMPLSAVTYGMDLDARLLQSSHISHIPPAG